MILGFWANVFTDEIGGFPDIIGIYAIMVNGASEAHSSPSGLLDDSVTLREEKPTAVAGVPAFTWGVT